MPRHSKNTSNKATAQTIKEHRELKFTPGDFQCPQCGQLCSEKKIKHTNFVVCSKIDKCHFKVSIKKREPGVIFQGGLKLKGLVLNEKKLSNSEKVQSIQVSDRQNNLKTQIERIYGIGSYSSSYYISKQLQLLFDSNLNELSQVTRRALRFNQLNQGRLPLEIKQSNIKQAGMGLFATERLLKKRIVMRYTGVVRCSSQLKTLSDSVYILGWIHDDQQRLQCVYVEPLQKLNAARFINSLFDDKGNIKKGRKYFNCQMKLGLSDGQLVLYLVTTRDIQLGQQLYYSYGGQYSLNIDSKNKDNQKDNKHKQKAQEEKQFQSEDNQVNKNKTNLSLVQRNDLHVDISQSFQRMQIEDKQQDINLQQIKQLPIVFENIYDQEIVRQQGKQLDQNNDTQNQKRVIEISIDDSDDSDLQGDFQYKFGYQYWVKDSMRTIRKILNKPDCSENMLLVRFQQLTSDQISKLGYDYNVIKQKQICNICYKNGLQRYLSQKRMRQHIKTSHTLFYVCQNILQAAKNVKFKGMYFACKSNVFFVDNVQQVYFDRKTVYAKFQEFRQKKQIIFFLDTDFKLSRKDGKRQYQKHIQMDKVLQVRTGQTQAINEQMEQSQRQFSRIFNIFGQPGIGKSTMMKWLSTRSKNRIYINLKTLTNVNNLVSLLQKKMKKIQISGRFVIILDQFDVVTNNKNPLIWRQLMRLKQDTKCSYFGVSNFRVQLPYVNNLLFQRYSNLVKADIIYNYVQKRYNIVRSQITEQIFQNIDHLISQIDLRQIFSQVDTIVKQINTPYALSRLGQSTISFTYLMLHPIHMLLLKRLLNIEQNELFPVQFYSEYQPQVVIYDLLSMGCVTITPGIIKFISFDKVYIQFDGQIDQKQISVNQKTKRFYGLNTTCNFLEIPHTNRQLLQKSIDFFQRKYGKLSFINLRQTIDQYIRQKFVDTKFEKQLQCQRQQPSRMEQQCSYITSILQALNEPQPYYQYQWNYLNNPWGSKYALKGPTNTGKIFLLMKKLQMFEGLLTIHIKVTQGKSFTMNSFNKEITNIMVRNGSDKYIKKRQNQVFGLKQLKSFIKLSNKSFALIIDGIQDAKQNIMMDIIYNVNEWFEDCNIRSKGFLVFVFDKLMRHNFVNSSKSRCKFIEINTTHLMGKQQAYKFIDSILSKANKKHNNQNTRKIHQLKENLKKVFAMTIGQDQLFECSYLIQTIKQLFITQDFTQQVSHQLLVEKFKKIWRDKKSYRFSLTAYQSQLIAAFLIISTTNQVFDSQLQCIRSLKVKLMCPTIYLQRVINQLIDAELFKWNNFQLVSTISIYDLFLILQDSQLKQINCQLWDEMKFNVSYQK